MKKVSTIDSNIEKIIDILTQSFEEQKVQLAQPQPKLTEFQKMLNAVNNRQTLDFEDLLKEKQIQSLKHLLLQTSLSKTLQVYWSNQLMTLRL